MKNGMFVTRSREKIRSEFGVCGGKMSSQQSAMLATINWKISVTNIIIIGVFITPRSERSSDCSWTGYKKLYLQFQKSIPTVTGIK